MGTREIHHTLFRGIHELFGFNGMRHEGFPHIAPTDFSDPICSKSHRWRMRFSATAAAPASDREQ